MERWEGKVVGFKEDLNGENFKKMEMGKSEDWKFERVEDEKELKDEVIFLQICRRGPGQNY